VVLTVTNTSGLSSQASVTASPQIGTNTPYVDDDGQGSANGQEPSGYTSYSSLSGASFFRRVQAAGGVTVSVPPGTYTLPGFTSVQGDADHAASGTAGIIGSGSAQTLITMAAQSSSGATYSGGTNPYVLGRLNGTGAGGLVQDCTLQGTPQSVAYTGTSYAAPNVYNGLTLTGNGWTLRRVKIKGIPGNHQAPPGETFGISAFKAYGTLTLENVEIDGQGFGASNFGINGSGTSATVPTTLLKVSKLWSHDNPYSGATAFWQTKFDTASFMDDSVFDKSRCFWNIERCSGTVTVNRPRIGTLQTKGAAAIGIFCESDAGWGAADSQAFRWIVRDPRNLDGTPYSGPKLVVQFGTAFDKGTNYYGRNNFKCYDAAGNDISASFFSFTSGGYN
jgi:hypothetical protein